MDSSINNYIREYVDASINYLYEYVDASLNLKVDKVEGESLINVNYIQEINNPEFIRVILDSSENILFGIQTDGNVYFGNGIPEQIRTKIDELYNKKVDKMEDSTLIPEQYVQESDNPEFIRVYIDSSGNILEGIRKDGSKLIGSNLEVDGNVKVIGNMEVSGISYDIIANPEYVIAWVDSDNKIMFGLKSDGKTYVGDADFLNDIKENKKIIDEIDFILSDTLDINSLSSITLTECDEYISVELDSSSRILAGRTPDGAAFENVGFSTPKVSIDGNIIKNIEDIEGRIEIITDNENKILSYRREDGVKVEELLKVENLEYGKQAMSDLKSIISDVTASAVDIRQFHLPEYGSVDIVSETFYLTSNAGYSDLSGVYLIQLYEDTDANAADPDKRVLGKFYLKTSLRKISDDVYELYNDGIEGHDIDLDFYAAGKVSLVNNKYYVTESLEEGLPVETSIEVTQLTDVPPIMAWKVNKKDEHFCVANIDFGYYLSGTFNIGVKYQGNSTLAKRKRNFRITFYKSNAKKYYPVGDDKFGKKDKVKLGEMVRLSGYNLKANYNDDSRIKEFIMNRIFMAMWENRELYPHYPWDTNNPYSGATGMIKGFPVRQNIGGQFYGIMIFGLKKDEKNYLLDGDDDASGIFVSGNNNDSDAWTNAVGKLNAGYWEDEMEAVKPMSQETHDALQTLFEFMNSANFTKENMPEYMSIIDWIDYFIGLQVFFMPDNMSNNIILYSASDKKKFYPFFYDLDLSWYLDTTYNKELLNYVHTTYNYDISMWTNFKNEWWDEIVNRYALLRNTVLTDGYIYNVYHSIVDNIPDSEYTLEHNKWGSGDKSYFEVLMQEMSNRLKWLDENYFKI